MTNRRAAFTGFLIFVNAFCVQFVAFFLDSSKSPSRHSPLLARQRRTRIDRLVWRAARPNPYELHASPFGFALFYLRFAPRDLFRAAISIGGNTPGSSCTLLVALQLLAASVPTGFKGSQSRSAQERDSPASLQRPGIRASGCHQGSALRTSRRSPLRLRPLTPAPNKTRWRCPPGFFVLASDLTRPAWVLGHQYCHRCVRPCATGTGRRNALMDPVILEVLVFVCY